jgi:hypothetical protein
VGFRREGKRVGVVKRIKVKTQIYKQIYRGEREKRTREKERVKKITPPPPKNKNKPPSTTMT